MTGIATIPLLQLLLAFLPVAVVLVLMWRWGLGYGNALHALVRMLAQLLLIGYVLVYIFDAESSGMVLLVLVVMVGAASWIALNTLEQDRASVYLPSLIAITVGGGATLALITQGVLRLEPWYKPQVMIPLAGMSFANAMTAVSLAAERLHAELQNGCRFREGRIIAFNTAMIPVVNALFAVGLVSLPGMMTGQILAGVSPFIAARYQIMVMCMIFAASGLSVACFLLMIKNTRAFRGLSKASS